MIQWLVDAGGFRNANHAIWFLCTVGIFLTMLIQRLLPHIVWLIPVTGVVVHVSPIVNAVRVSLRNERSDLYTPDCIVFNSLMLVVYAGAFFFFRHRETE